MKMDGQEESSNVEDVRGMGRGGGGGGMGGFGLGGEGSTAPTAQTAPPATAGNPPQPQVADPKVTFVSKVLRSTEVVWRDVFQESGRTYQAPKLVIFRDAWPTACGRGEAAMGPFYCPGDSKVYIDLGFYDVLGRQLGAHGDFAQAYVIAHEVGHHVQAQLGIMEKVDAARQRASATQGNAISVRVELQADCFAGVWAKRSQAEMGWRLEPGDIEEGLNAAAQIGDDMLQGRARGVVVPEKFTHGSSAQRVSWFRRGLQSGSLEQCNTFDSRAL